MTEGQVTYLYGSKTKTVAASDLTPLKAIRAKCLDCSAGSAHEAKLCAIPACPLYAYRFGKNPFRKPRKLTEEQRREIAERFEKARQVAKLRSELLSPSS
jgi:hypothetical protein